MNANSFSNIRNVKTNYAQLYEAKTAANIHHFQGEMLNKTINRETQAAANVTHFEGGKQSDRNSH